MTTTLKFPQDLLRFLYWVFFKPITLDRYIHEIDPSLGTDPSLFTLWRRSKSHPEFRSLIPLAFFHILITPWLIAFPVAGLFALFGFDVNWSLVAVGVAVGVSFIAGYFRLPLYFFELPWQFLLARFSENAPLPDTPFSEKIANLF